MDNFWRALDEGDMVLLDLSVAFDTIDLVELAPGTGSGEHYFAVILLLSLWLVAVSTNGGRRGPILVPYYEGHFMTQVSLPPLLSNF